MRNWASIAAFSASWSIASPCAHFTGPWCHYDRGLVALHRTHTWSTVRRIQLWAPPWGQDAEYIPSEILPSVPPGAFLGENGGSVPLYICDETLETLVLSL